MSTALTNQRRELEDVKTIRFITSALFDLSAEKINRLRTAFEKNKSFYDDIAYLYHSIKLTASGRGELPEKTGKVVRIVSVAFTSNMRFYGAVNSEVIRTFVEHMRSGATSDYMVIGKVGRTLMGNYPDLEKLPLYYSFENDEPTREEIAQFLKNIVPYTQVLAFYPSFVNVFAQKVAAQDITYASQGEPMTKNMEIDYIFEPELSKILEFFETRVRYLLFQRVMLESELARTASRLFSMNRAQDRADEEIVVLRRAIRQSIETFNDLRLLESFSMISKWKK